MTETTSRVPCCAAEMNAALGPYGEFVDIREREVFARWHHRPGLRCLGCRQPVTPYRSRVGNPFVRHGRGDAATRNSSAVTSARETFLHQRLKYWVRDELRNFGATDTEVETAVGDRRPDVFGHHDGRGYAVEVQWSALEQAVAATRTAGLKAAGADEVLWLTRPCSWVQQLPALGIATFDPPGDDYHAHTGHLTYRPNTGLRVTEASVRDALRRWLAGELVWAHLDHKKAGWAAVTDWEHHTRDQAATIEDQRRQLREALAKRDERTAELQKAAAGSEVRDGRISRQKATIDEQAVTITDTRQQLTDAVTEIKRLNQTNRQQRVTIAWLAAGCVILTVVLIAVLF